MASSPKTSVICYPFFQWTQDSLGADHLRAGATHPVVDLFVYLLVAPPPLALGRPPRTGASGPRLQLGPTQYSQQPWSRSTSRRKTLCHGFQDSRRYTRRRPLRTIWQGISIIAARNVPNSIPNSVRF